MAPRGSLGTLGEPYREITLNYTHYVHLMVTPSAVRQLNHMLHQPRGIKGCRDHTIVWGGSRY